MKTSLSILFMILTCFVSYGQSNITPNSNYKSRVIKTAIFAPLVNHLEFGYEQALNNKIILDGDLGIIGPSVSNFDQNASGLYFKAGTKFFFNPDFMVEGMFRYNDFQGTYFEPQLIYSSFGYDVLSYTYNPNTGNSTSQTYRGTSNSWALSMNLGRQWVLANVLSLNLFGGVGYGGSYNSTNEPTGTFIETIGHPYKFSHLAISNDFPIIFTNGITLGILLK